MTVEVNRTRIRIEASFAAVVCLMLIFCQKRIVILSLFSSVTHECGHLMMMCLFRDVPQMITLSAFGMRIDRNNGLLPYKKEMLIAMGGIIVNIFTSVVSIIAYSLSDYISFAEVAIVNFLIALVNMMPVGMLDFARALNSFLLCRYEMKKAQKISDIISGVFIAGFVLFSICYCIFIKANLSLIAVTVYLFTSYKKRS